MPEKTVAQSPEIEVVENLEQLYRLERPDEVKAFLEQHLFLMPALYEAYPLLRGYFPTEELVLEVVIDTELSSWVTLWLNIIPNVSTQNELEKLEQLEHDWYLELPFIIRESFIIDLEYR